VGHHKVIGERCRHLQRVVAFNVGIRPDQRRLEFPEVHSVLDAVAGMVVLSQRQKQEQLSRFKRIEGWSMWQGQCSPFQLLDHMIEKKRQLNCCAITVA
jgi:hypothetical protein